MPPRASFPKARQVAAGLQGRQPGARIPAMPPHRPSARTGPVVAASLALALAAAAVLLVREHRLQQDAFDTDARIAHRLLSQQAVQHDAMLAMLALLQPGTTDSAAAQRLAALFPQVLRVQTVEPADLPAPAQALLASSRQQQRAVIEAVDAAAGTYTLLRAGEPRAYRLVLQARRLVPAAEWPLPDDAHHQAWLALGGQRLVLQGAEGAAPGPWRFSASKRLAADSQPFELHVARTPPWSALPWAGLALSMALAGAAGAGLHAWRRQREEARRSRELLRMGQVERLGALGELAAGMAHELNQPLTAVLSSTQAAARLLADDEPDLDTVRRALAHSAEQARRAGDVVGRLRRLVQPADPGSAPVRVPLAPAVAGLLDLLQPTSAAQGVAVQAEVPPGLAVQADPVALEQILHNLATNALQALAQVPEGQRRLWVTARPAGAQVELVVADSGPGFSAEALARAFEPFFTTRAGGLGLGLSLSETLAAGMGGALQARARDGGGAALVLTLPAAPAA